MKNTNTNTTNKLQVKTFAEIEKAVNVFNEAIDRTPKEDIEMFVISIRNDLNILNDETKNKAVEILASTYIAQSLTRQEFFNNYLSDNNLIDLYTVNYAQKANRITINTYKYRPTLYAIQKAIKAYDSEKNTTHNIYAISEQLLNQQLKIFVNNLHRASLNEICTVPIKENCTNSAVYNGTNIKALKAQLDDIMSSIYGNIDYPKLGKKDIEVLKKCFNRAYFKEQDSCKISSARANTIVQTIVKMQTTKGYKYKEMK